MLTNCGYCSLATELIYLATALLPISHTIRPIARLDTPCLTVQAQVTPAHSSRRHHAASIHHTACKLSIHPPQLDFSCNPPERTTNMTSLWETHHSYQLCLPRRATTRSTLQPSWAWLPLSTLPERPLARRVTAAPFVHPRPLPALQRWQWRQNWDRPDR